MQMMSPMYGPALPSQMGPLTLPGHTPLTPHIPMGEPPPPGIQSSGHMSAYPAFDIEDDEAHNQ